MQDCIVKKKKKNALAIFGFVSLSCLLSPRWFRSVLGAAFPLCSHSLNSSPCPAPVIRLWCHGTVEKYSVGHSELIALPLSRWAEGWDKCFIFTREPTMQRCVTLSEGWGVGGVIIYKQKPKKHESWAENYRTNKAGQFYCFMSSTK